MSELILGLLHYSRVGQEAEQKVISTQQMLKAVLIDLHALIVRYQVKIRIAKLPSIKANPVALRQVFQHLLENAIKFQRPGASIEVQVSCQQVDGFHQFCIEDNGIGIPKAYQEKIFLIFQQLHQKNEYDGNGMGLALCKKIIEMHKGKIWLQSEPNAGTKFYFSLPA
ncbi:MAG: ATP-binding protein [Bacteroidota bacterium]